MNLSILLLILIPIFLIPALLLSKNRLQFYLLCAFPSTILVLLLFFINVSLPFLSLNEKIGKTFLPMWHWLYQRYIELNNKEIIHLSCSFTYLFFYFICYLLFYIPLKFVFIGSNPDIHKPIKTFTRIIYIIFFMLSTYGVAFVFLAQIRQILPFPDGFLSFFFNLLYPIEV